MAFYQYIGTVTRVYDAFDITAQPTGPIYDFGSNQPPADGNWASHAGPATAVPDNQQVQFPPGVPPVSQTLSVLAWATATFYKAGMGVISPTTGMLSICQTPHTAGTYATDLAAGKWSETMTTAGANAAYQALGGPFAFRGRDIPGSAGIPGVNTAAGTATVLPANASSGISGAVNTFVSKDQFRPFGVEPQVGTSFPETLGWTPQLSYVHTTIPPWGVEFDLDTVLGVFEIQTKGAGAQIRIAVNGQYISYGNITVALTGTPTGGTFTLSYGGQTTSAIAYNASAATVQAALVALSSIGAGGAIVRGSGPWTIDLAQSVVQADGAAMTTTSSLTGGSSPTVQAGGGIWTPADGNGYLVSVNLGAGGTYRIRVEMGGNTRLWGINIGPTDSVSAGSKLGPRVAGIGDSFWEPTLTDQGNYVPSQGLSPMLAHTTGWDVFPCGSGGTGLVAINGGRVAYPARMPEILAIPNLDAIVIAMTGNDASFATSAVMTALQSCITQAQAAGLTRPWQITVLSSWNVKGYSAIPASILDQHDAALTLCASLGIPFIDLLSRPVPGGVSGTATTVDTTHITSSVLVPISQYFKVGQNGNQEVRQVINFAGAGPWTLQISGSFPLANTHTADPIVQVYPPELSGLGHQGATTGSGTADRYTGTDGTHPTIKGALYRALRIAHGVRDSWLALGRS